MSESSKIWIIDDDRSIRWVLEKALSKENYTIESFESGVGIMDRLQKEQPDAILSDVRMPGIDGIELLKQIREFNEHIPVVIMTAHSDLDSAVNSYQSGAFEYLPKPFDLEDAVAIAKRAIAHSQEHKSKNSPLASKPDVSPTEIIGEAPAMQEVFRAIGRLSQSNITVLINGQSGTGKELVARALHQHSPRSNEAFIALNMAAIPRELIESELFGHEKGSFTGAAGQRAGRFEQANGGTLFLDEIGDMPGETQTRLLRVLADGEFYRVGGTTPIRTDVRIIAATHQNLENLVNSGSFREDLFHRLNVIRIHLPKLSERREDIPKLTKFFLEKAARELNVETKELRQEAADYLTEMPWPGNVRQLENTCRWLTVMASGREIHVSDLPPELLELEAESATGSTWQESLALWADQELRKGKKGILDQAVPEFEKIMIHAALNHTGGRKRDASILLGWGRNTLTRKIKELSLEGLEEEE